MLSTVQYFSEFMTRTFRQLLPVFHGFSKGSNEQSDNKQHTHTKGVHSGEHVQNFSTSSVLYYAVGQCFH